MQRDQAILEADRKAGIWGGKWQVLKSGRYHYVGPFNPSLLGEVIYISLGR